MNDLGKVLFGLGLALILLGVILGTDIFNLGMMPGDLVWRRGNLTLFLPLGTMLLVSLVISLVLAFIRRC